MSNTTDALEARYKLLIACESPWAFFHALGEYTNYVMSTPQLKEIVDREFAKRNAALYEVDMLEEQALAEMRSAKKTLLNIIKARKIDTKILTPTSLMLTSLDGEKTLVGEMEKFERGDISVGGFHSDYLRDYLFEIAATILKLGYVDDLKKFTVSDREYGIYQEKFSERNSITVFGRNERGNFIFSETWPKRVQKMYDVENSCKLESWGAFEAIIKFWKARAEAIKNANPSEIFHNCFEDKEYSFRDQDADDVVCAANDLITLSKNHNTPETHLEFLKTEDLKTQATTVRFQLMGALAAIDGSPMKQDKLVGKWWKDGDLPLFDEKNAKIVLGSKTCIIPIGSNQAILCEAVFSKSIGEWTNETEVIDDFFKGDTSEQGFYDAIRSVNRKIEKDMNIINMLKYKASKVHINPALFQKKI